MTTSREPIKTFAYVADHVQTFPEKTTKTESIDVSDPETEESNTRPEFEKKLLRKIDLWLVGFYSLVYVFRVIDSANYSNAAIINLEAGTGIKKQLGLNPSQWAWTLSIFSYSYLIFEPTNTILLKLFRPSRWMFILIMAWGVSACCSAAAINFSGMMCVRFAIGMAEAGFFPSVLYHYAFWYKPEEMPQRIAFFYSVGQVSSALSGLLAYAISYMDQLGNVSGWRWLFILEGLPAIFLAFFAFWLPDYPESAKMLSEEERLYMKQRLASSVPKGEASWDFKSLKVMARDPTLYTFSLYWICHGIGGFGVGFALPTVIYQLGFTTTAYSQLMNIPPYVSAFLLLNILGFMLQRKWIRPWVTAVGIESTIIVCYIILLFVDNPVVRYICLIVSVACAGCAYPVIWPERIRALEGTVASGIGIGLTNACAQFGGIVGPHVFSTVFGPRYRTSYAVNLSVLVVGICSILTSWLLVVRKDRKRLTQD
ncbi:high-affinity nicotinic acid transporter [Colletotrichum paranaense]|uniref:High-affinity nicotinic acid transporter n=1 Tax=Colletotrichum paranaense TaxID=1914294 RepID=A0ABQ9SNB0_9PEZI|nr:high-affinity nicotinic acid transporter [Colletotrichum paranaense]KAK1541000.1 high-affinity nicotinic acid transporter [Colletotrichum paranaense]